MSERPKELTDCKFFFKGTCKKGESCVFRHASKALKTEEMCRNWVKTPYCTKIECGFRHPAGVEVKAPDTAKAPDTPKSPTAKSDKKTVAAPQATSPSESKKKEARSAKGGKEDVEARSTKGGKEDVGSPKSGEEQKKLTKKKKPRKKATKPAAAMASPKRQAADFLFGLHTLQLGVDVTTGAQKLPVLDWSIGAATLQKFEGKDVPIDYVHNAPVNTYRSDHKVCNSESEYRALLAGQFSVNAFGGVLSASAGASSASSSFKGKSMIRVRNRFIIRELSIKASSEKLVPFLEPNFRDAIEKLPAEFDADAYAHFIHMYGTDFVARVSVGGERSRCAYVESSRVSKEFDVKAALQAAGPLFMGGGVSGQKSSSEMKSSSFSTDLLEVQGGDVTIHDKSKWEKSVSMRPASFIEDKRPLKDLITDPQKRKHFQTALDAHIKKTPKVGVEREDVCRLAIKGTDLVATLRRDASHVTARELNVRSRRQVWQFAYKICEDADGRMCYRGQIQLNDFLDEYWTEDVCTFSADNEIETRKAAAGFTGQQFMYYPETGHILFDAGSRGVYGVMAAAHEKLHLRKETHPQFAPSSFEMLVEAEDEADEGEDE